MSVPCHEGPPATRGHFCSEPTVAGGGRYYCTEKEIYDNVIYGEIWRYIKLLMYCKIWHTTECIKWILCAHVILDDKANVETCEGLLALPIYKNDKWANTSSLTVTADITITNSHPNQHCLHTAVIKPHFYSFKPNTEWYGMTGNGAGCPLKR